VYVAAPMDLVAALPAPPAGHVYAMPASSLPILREMYSEYATAVAAYKTALVSCVSAAGNNPTVQNNSNYPLAANNSIGASYTTQPQTTGRTDTRVPFHLPQRTTHARNGVCRRVMRGLTCDYGASCRFSHDVSSSSTATVTPDDGSPRSVPSSGSGPLHGGRKRGFCNEFQRGECRRGERCVYAHEIDPASSKPCFEFRERGTCHFPKCRFMHVAPGPQTTSLKQSASAPATAQSASAPAHENGDDSLKQCVSAPVQEAGDASQLHEPYSP